MLKNLVKNLKPSSTLAINETSRKLEEQGKKIFKFGFGQSPFKVPQDIVEELKNNVTPPTFSQGQSLTILVAIFSIIFSLIIWGIDSVFGEVMKFYFNLFK